MKPAETLRKLAHMAALWPAFTLAWLSPLQALGIAFALVLMNIFILPKFAPVLFRKEEKGSGALEVILYPIAVMVCIMVYGQGGKPAWYLPVFAAWYGLAIVDALIGICCRIFPQGPTLPWNSRKPIFGVILGAGLASLPAFFLAQTFLPHLGIENYAGKIAGNFSWNSDWIFSSAWIWILPLIAVCAFAETAWFGIADNIVIPFTLCILIPFLPSPLLNWNFYTGDYFNSAFPFLTFLNYSFLHPAFLLPAFLIPLGFGLTAYFLKLLSFSGSVLGAFLSFLLVLANPWLFLFLGGFFLLGNVATRFGKSQKQKLGIAEARGGRRGAAQVFGAMGVAAWFTPLVLQLKFQNSEKIHLGFLICITPLIAKTMDTVSSEIGKAMGGNSGQAIFKNGKTISLKTFKSVLPGTVGAVSTAGTLWGIIAAIILSLPILILGWGGIGDILALVFIAISANIFESFWGEWAAPRGLDQGAHKNVLMTIFAAGMAWLWWMA